MVRLIAFVACLAAIGSYAAPVFVALDPEPSDNPKDWPTTAQLVKVLATAPNEAWFWSGQTNGVRVFEEAQKMALESGGTTLEVLLKTANFKMPGFPRKTQAAKDKWVEAATIYSEGATGNLNVVLGAEIRPNGKSVWERLEKPALLDNPKVASITMTAQTTHVKTVIFQRNKKRQADDVEPEQNENAHLETSNIEDLPIEDILLEKRAKKVTAARPKAAPVVKVAPRPPAPKKVTVAKPVAAVKRPAVAVKRPAAAVKRPAAVAGKPAAVTKKPAVNKATAPKAPAPKSSTPARKNPPNLRGFEFMDV